MRLLTMRTGRSRERSMKFEDALSIAAGLHVHTRPDRGKETLSKNCIQRMLCCELSQSQKCIYRDPGKTSQDLAKNASIEALARPCQDLALGGVPCMRAKMHLSRPWQDLADRDN